MSVAPEGTGSFRVGSGSGVFVAVELGSGVRLGSARVGEAVGTLEIGTLASGVTLAVGLAVAVKCIRVGNRVNVAGTQAVIKTNKLPVRNKRRIIRKL